MRKEIIFENNNPHFNFDLPDCVGNIYVTYTWGEKSYPERHILTWWHTTAENPDNIGKIKKVVFEWEQEKLISDFNPKKVRWMIDDYSKLPQAYYPLKVPSVSKIVDLIPDPEWEKFIEEVGKEKAEELKQLGIDRGNALHILLENFIKKLTDTKDPTAALEFAQRESVTAFEKENIPADRIDMGKEMFFSFYYSEFPQRYLHSGNKTEMPIYSPFMFFRGKADLVYALQGIGTCVTDWKSTSKRIEEGTAKMKKYKVQVGGYAVAVEDMYKNQGKNTKVARSSIVAIHTRGSFIQEIMCEGEELEEQKEKFKTLCLEWHRINNQAFLFGE